MDEDLATPLHYAARYKRQRIKHSESQNQISSDDADGGQGDDVS